jgi:ABC-2 type transport system permease protein
MTSQNQNASPPLVIHSSETHVVLRPWDSFLTLYQREMARFMKVIFQTVFTPMINSVLYLMIFGVSLGKSITMDKPVTYLAFLIPGLTMMGVLNNAFQNSSSSIVSGKFSGDLEDLKVVPLTPQMIIWALSIGGLTRGLLVGCITFVIGEIFSSVVDHTWLAVAHPFWLVFFLIVGGLTFAKLGIAIAFYAKNFDQLSAVGAFVLVPLIYLGGVFFSMQGLHPFWQALARFNPVLYLINGVRYGVLGISDVDITSAAAISLVFLVLFHVLGYKALAKGDFQRW